jgi:hypothetical protein
MSGSHQPPPGALPPGMGSPDMGDMEDMMAQMQQGNPAPGGQTAPSQQAISSALQGKKPGSSSLGPVQEAKSVVKGVGEGLTDFLPGPLQNILGIKSTDGPEEVARKKQMLQNFNKLEADQQEVVAQKMRQREMEARQKQEEEAHQKQIAQQQQSQDLPVPQGKVRGDAQAGQSKKQNTVNKLQNDRKKMTSAH